MPRLNLAIYNYWKPSGDWGPRHYLHRVFGKPPVLLKNVKPKFRVKVMKQRLYDMGLFDSDITLDLKVYGKNDKKVRAKYSVLFKPAYTIRNLNFVNKHSKLDSIINLSLDNSLIKNGNDYWIKDLKAERSRLSKIIKNQGYYYTDIQISAVPVFRCLHHLQYQVFHILQVNDLYHPLVLIILC